MFIDNFHGILKQKSLKFYTSSTSMAAVEALSVTLSLRKGLERPAGTEEDDLCDNAVKLIRINLR